MKLKELPYSLYHIFCLRRTSPRNLLEKHREQVPVVVSLTSYKPRLGIVDITIRSIFNQSYLPEKIVLWINENEMELIPKRLKTLENDFFQVKETSLTTSHKKLIHTIEEFPQTAIITIDDDVIYPSNLVENLYKQHLEHPTHIIGNMVRKIGYENGEIAPYKHWSIVKDSALSDKNLAIGGSGILYPPGALHKDVQDVKTFMQLAPRADDLWFKVMALKNNTSVMKAGTTSGRQYPIFGSQKTALKNTNVNEDKNRQQWKQLVNYFDLKL